MSAVTKETEVPPIGPIPPMGKNATTERLGNESKQPPAHYKGFVAGVFSGIAKLTVGHP